MSKAPWPLRSGAIALNAMSDLAAGATAAVHHRLAGSGLHIFTVDGYSGAGSYDVQITFPYTPIT